MIICMEDTDGEKPDIAPLRARIGKAVEGGDAPACAVRCGDEADPRAEWGEEESGWAESRAKRAPHCARG